MEGRIERWLLLSGRRFSVAGVVLVLMVGIVLTPLVTRFAIRSTDPLYYLASSLITGNLTLITVVVAIDQVVLSQELESPGSLRDEIEQTVEFRQAALDQQAPPTQPADFLRQLLEQTQEHVESVGEHRPDATDDVDDRFQTELPDRCSQVLEQVDPASDKLSDVIVPILGDDYGDYLRECQGVAARYGEDDHERLHAMLEHLVSDLENLDVARQYFTTAFVKEELATLSRTLLYVGILAVSVPVALLLQLTTYAVSAPPLPVLLVLAVLTTVFGLMPLAILISFVLRIATVAQHIATIAPFRA